MGRRYEFRFNTVSNDLEFRQKDSIPFYFQPVDQRARNSISMDALQEGIKVWDRDVNRYLASNRVPLYLSLIHISSNYLICSLLVVYQNIPKGVAKLMNNL